jgi:hypothetical protein
MIQDQFVQSVGWFVNFMIDLHIVLHNVLHRHLRLSPSP